MQDNTFGAVFMAESLQQFTRFKWLPILRPSQWQGFHASWKVLDFILKFPGPGKYWKNEFGSG